MNNKHLSRYKEINNNFIIASRAYFLHQDELKLQVGDIEICKIHTDLNVADPLTKPLSRAKHDHTLVLFGC